MAQFYGYIKGQRGEATRLGGKSSGMIATARGWNVGGNVYISYNEEKDRDEVTLYLDGGSKGAGSTESLGIFYRDKGKYIKIK